MSVSVTRGGSTVSLTVGGRKVRFEAANAGWVRSALSSFVATGGGARSSHAAGGDNLVSKGGGTDAQPQVWLSNSDGDGESLGSVWLSVDQARAALDQLG